MRFRTGRFQLFFVYVFFWYINFSALSLLETDCLNYRKQKKLKLAENFREVEDVFGVKRLPRK